MTDLIDRANAQAQSLLDSQLDSQLVQIRQIVGQSPNDTDECIDCGQPIGAERKKILPYAVRCVGCQWQWERTHERGGR